MVSCRHLDLEIKVWAYGAILAPGTTGMRQPFFTKEIYFAVSEIRPLSVLVRSF
jgi:hypothetical protein